MINYANLTNSSNLYDITPRPFELNLKVGIGYDDSSVINTSISFNPIFLEVDLSSRESALESLASIDDCLKSVNEQLLSIGAVINRLQLVLEEQSIKLENMISSRSTLRDADLAEESSNYIKYQILQQASSNLMTMSRGLRQENVLGLLYGLN
jgi:flagellin